jgi:uncharacterized protein YvpB
LAPFLSGKLLEIGLVVQLRAPPLVHGNEVVSFSVHAQVQFTGMPGQAQPSQVERKAEEGRAKEGRAFLR